MRSTILAVLLFSAGVAAAQKPRARDLGIPFDGKPGKYNAITDVAGVLVGYKTLISGRGRLETGKGPVRTGVTVILPQGKSNNPWTAGWFCLNGDGEMTGTTTIKEYGLGYGPIGITNTNSVGVVRDAIGAWSVKHFSTGGLVDFSFGLPVVAETFDGMLNDINGLHVKKEHVWDALDSAHGGAIAEGNVGGGTGMSLFGFKGGNGSSSRIVRIDSTTSYTVGVFVQANFGGRQDLLVAGIPVGREIKGAQPVLRAKPKDGSIIVVVATDAPLLPSYLELLAKRASLGVARTGGMAYNSSGDIFIAFSTKAPQVNEKETMAQWASLPKERLDGLYRATVLATEEAIINALIAAETMEGVNGNINYAIPQDQLVEILKKYNRIK